MGNQNDDLGNDDSTFGTVTGSIKRAVGGLSTMLASEESLRSTLGDLPKDAISYLVNQTERTRDDLKKTISEEVKSFLAKQDLTVQLREALKGMTIELKAEINFKDNGEVDAEVESSLKGGPEQSTPEPEAPTETQSTGSDVGE